MVAMMIKIKIIIIMFCLIVDDFGVKYVGKQHAEHLATVLKKYHNITEYWTGKNILE